MTRDGALPISADLVAGAEGCHFVVCEKAAMPRDDYSGPIDVLSVRLSKKRDDRPARLDASRQA